MLQVRETSPFGFPILEVTGDLHVDSFEILEQALLKTLESRPERVGMDLRGVTYADLVGVSAVESAAQATRKLGGRLIIVGVSSDYRRAAMSGQRWMKLGDLCSHAPQACASCLIARHCNARVVA